MVVMRNILTHSRATAKEVTHERIVAVAARAIRRSGYDGTGVADIMKEAGLTHGAFYAHFASREAMLVEALDFAGAQSNAAAQSVTSAVPPVPPSEALQSFVQTYLSKEHIQNIEVGCPISALASEMPRQSPLVRSTSTRRIKEMIDLVARQLPEAGGQISAYDRALVTVSTMVGALILARAVDESDLSDALCSATLKSLTQA